MTYQKTVGALCADDYKGPNRQYVEQDKLVLAEREREMGGVGIHGDVSGTLDASYYKGCGERAMVEREVVMEPTESVVRRLMPEECEMLQGYPVGWTNIGPWTDSKGKLHKESSDSARYKALGNSIATGPNSFWKWMLKRIAAQSTRELTMGSLFDGIGGFPMIHEQINGKGSCLWASEIEEFCIAVTKKRFPEGENDE